MRHLWQPYQRVSRHELRFQIRQRADAMILFFIAVRLLVADQRDEEAEFGDLDGDGLDVHAVEAVFDEVEFAAVIVVVVGEVGHDL